VSNDYQPFDFSRAQAETIVYGYCARGDTTHPRRWIPEAAEQEPCLSVPEFHQLILSPVLFAHGYREQHRRHLSLSAAPGTQTRHSHPSAAPSTHSTIPSSLTSWLYHTPPPSPQTSLYSLPVGQDDNTRTKALNLRTLLGFVRALPQRLQRFKSNIKRRLKNVFGGSSPRPQPPRRRSI